MFYATYDVVKKMADEHEEEVRLAKEKLHHELDMIIKEIMDNIENGIFKYYVKSRAESFVRTLDLVGYTEEDVLELLKGKFEEVSKQYDGYFKEIIIEPHDIEKNWIRVKYKHLAYKLKKDEISPFYKLLHRILDEEVYSALIRKEKVLLYPLREFSRDVNNFWNKDGLDFSGDPQVRTYVLSFVMDKLMSLGYEAAIVSKDGAKVNFNELDEDKFQNNEYRLKINLG